VGSLAFAFVAAVAFVAFVAAASRCPVRRVGSLAFALPLLSLLSSLLPVVGVSVEWVL
jgi:EamA domain-containing membrane protein RarD